MTDSAEVGSSRHIKQEPLIDGRKQTGIFGSSSSVGSREG